METLTLTVDSRRMCSGVRAAPITASAKGRRSLGILSGWEAGLYVVPPAMSHRLMQMNYSVAASAVEALATSLIADIT
jgi:hypothetical protein